MGSIASSSTMSIAESQSDESSQESTTTETDEFSQESTTETDEFSEESTTETDEEVSELYESTHLTLRNVTRGLKEALKEIKIVKNENAQLRERVAKLEFLNSQSSSQNRNSSERLDAETFATMEPSVPVKKIPVENEHVNPEAKKDVFDREIELRKIALKELQLTMEQDILKHKMLMEYQRMDLASRRLGIEECKSKAEIKRLQDDQDLKLKRMEKEFEFESEKLQW